MFVLARRFLVFTPNNCVLSADKWTCHVCHLSSLGVVILLVVAVERLLHLTVVFLVEVVVVGIGLHT